MRMCTSSTTIPPGKLRVLRDKPGMTEVDHTYTTMETYNGDSGEVTIETGYVLFTPSGAQAQYAICSPIVDGEGNILFQERLGLYDAAEQPRHRPGDHPAAGAHRL